MAAVTESQAAKKQATRATGSSVAFRLHHPDQDLLMTAQWERTLALPTFLALQVALGGLHSLVLGS